MSEIDFLQSELDAAKSQVSDLTKAVEGLKARLAERTSERSKTLNENASLSEKLTKKAHDLDVANAENARLRSSVAIYQKTLKQTARERDAVVSEEVLRLRKEAASAHSSAEEHRRAHSELAAYKNNVHLAARNYFLAQTNALAFLPAAIGTHAFELAQEDLSRATAALKKVTGV